MKIAVTYEINDVRIARIIHDYIVAMQGVRDVETTIDD